MTASDPEGAAAVAALLARVDAEGRVPLAEVGLHELAGVGALSGPVVDGAAAAWWAALGDGERAEAGRRGRRSLRDRDLLRPARAGEAGGAGDGGALRPGAVLAVALLARARPSVVAVGVTAVPGAADADGVATGPRPAGGEPPVAGAPWMALYGVAEEAAGLRWVLEEEAADAGGTRRWTMATPAGAATDLAAWACGGVPGAAVVRAVEVVRPDPGGPRRDTLVVEVAAAGARLRRGTLAEAGGQGEPVTADGLVPLFASLLTGTGPTAPTAPA